jgi:hypothetical protein
MLQPSRSRSITDPAKDAGDLIVRLGLFVLAVGIPCAAVVSRRAIFSLTPIGAVLLLVSALLTQRRAGARQTLASFLSPIAVGLIFLALWSGLSLAWTPWLDAGASRFLRTAGTLLIVALAGVLSPQRTKTPNLYLLPFGVGVAGLAIVAMVIFRHEQLVEQGVSLDDSTLARASVGVLMLAWPSLAALAVRERWIPAGAVGCAAAAAVLAVGSPFAIIGLAAGAAALVLSLVRARTVAFLCAVLVGIIFALAPLLALVAGALVERLPNIPSALAWTPALSSFVRSEGLRLLTGHGLDTASRAAAAGAVPSAIAHSMVFEAWYELGALGALMAGFVSFLAFRDAASAPRPMPSFAVAALVCGLTLSVLELPTAQLWWISLVSVAGLFFAVVKRGRYRTQRPRVSLVSAEPRQPVA